ncbi:hypothetical protein EBZ80_24075 [bacterium]|nr:hypothetical protein [bacterium]
MNCSQCNQPIEPERIDLGFTRCKGCAFDRPEPKVKGAMTYHHKTAGSLNVMAPESYDHFKKLSRRVGQRSTLRNVLHSGGRLV